MKNFNLIEKLQGCSKRNGTTFRQSNPDGQTTVKRQSRVMSQSGCSAVDVPMTSYGAPDEHPMSTRSASDGTRWNSRGWKYVAMIFAVLVMSMANIGMAWGADITVTPYAPTNITSIPYGLFTLSHSSTKSSSKVSSGAITTGSNGDVITIHFATTKSDMYIKSITFNSLSNGTLSSSDGTISSNTFTASSSKNAVDIVLTSGASAKGTVKITNVVIDPGTNDVETISFTAVSSGTVSFTSSAATSALSSITTNGASVSSNILSWANSKTLTFSSSRKLTYIALQRNDGKNDSFTSSPTGMSDFAWSGNSNTVTFTNSAGGGRPFIKAYIIAAPACTSISPSLSYTSTSLMVGDNSSAPTLSGNTGSGAVTWTSSNTDVATVNSSGVVTAEGAGSATITASIAANGGYCEDEATAEITVQRDPIGSGHTLTWEITTVSGSSEDNVTATTDIGTGTKTPTSSYLTSMTNLTGVGVNRTTSGKNSNTGKIETPSAYDADKYVTMTFAVASGYQFTPSSVSIKTVAVKTTKDLKFEISDAKGSYSVTKTELSTSADAATNTLDFSSCDRAFTGTVTVKIYVYGANDTYRLSTPLVITGTVAAAAVGCPYYSFHTGGNDVKENNTQSCFVNYTSTEEWQLRDYTIPADTKFFVGERGYWYDSDLGNNHSRSSAQTWASEMYLAKSFDSGDAAGSPKLGQATGATGTIRIYDNSSWNNLNAAFIPDGYVLKVGSNEHAFAFLSSNEYRTDIVEINSTTYDDAISVGVKNSSNGYVATANSQELRHIFFVPSPQWKSSNAKFCIHYWGAGDSRIGFMSEVPGKSGWYEGWLPSGATGFQFERQNPAGSVPSESNRWTAGDNQTLQDGKNCYTMTATGDSWDQTITTSLYSASGKYRIWDNSKSINWYVTFVPYYVLRYNANDGSNAPAQQSIETTASPCQLTVAAGSGMTAPTGYQFLGWNPNESQADAGTKDGNYDPGDTPTMSDDVTLYAVWAPIPVSSITVSPASKTLDVGGTQTLTATVAPATALDKAVTWSSDNTGVATVDESGVVTAEAPGSCTITATAHDGSGVTGTCAITVNKITPTKYSFSVDKEVLCGEETATLTLAGSQSGVTYELREDSSTPIDGTQKAGTGSALTWTGLAAGTYRPYAVADATYNAKEMGSNKIAISAGTATSITTQPTNQTVTVGEEATLTVVAAGTSLSYQWKESATEDGEYSNVSTGSGKTSASYSVTPAAAGTKWYKCVVTGTCGTETTAARKIVANAAVVEYATSIDFEAIIDESGTSAAWKTTMEGRNYTLTQADGSKWTLDNPDPEKKPSDKGLKIKETGEAAGKITFTVRANQTVELKVGTLAGTNSGTAKFSTDGGSSYTDITGATTASTGEPVTYTYTGATDKTYVFKTSSASWNIVQHIIIGYKITYDKGANGTGTINPMYKTHGTNITLSSSRFTRDGYTQDGWSTSDGGSKVYELGASYTTDAPITLYPHWVEDACTSVDAPTALTCSAQTSSTLTFSWTEADNASGYVAKLWTNSECSGAAVKTQDPVNTNSVTFTSLSASTTYWCKIQSKGDGSTYCAEGGITAAQSGTTDAACTAHGLAYASTSVEKNVGDAAFTNTLTNPNSLSVTYSSSNTSAATVNATSGMVTIEGAGSTVITATWAGDATYCSGTATYTLTVSSGCTPQSLSKVSATKGTSGTVTGYNDGQYAGDAVVKLYDSSPQSASLPGVGSVDGYKMGDAGTSIVFATLKGTSFQAGDKVRIGITKKNDTRTVDASKDILTIYYGTSKSDATALHTITGVTGAGFYEYTLSLADVTAIGSKKGIGLFRESDNGENPYVYSVEIIGCREWATCTAPDAVAVGSVTGEGATFTITDALNTNNYEIYYSTSSTAPTAETSATISGISSKSRAVTGLTAETTYYYWVRSNCGGATKSSWVAGTPATFTTSAAAATHKVTYNGNGSTGGSVPTDDTDYEEGDIVTVKGNTGSLVKTGQTFLGWSTSSTASTGIFYPAGYKFYMPNEAVTLYAVWGSTGATCVTITDFETNSYAKSSNKPDSEGYYFYGYKGTKDAAHAVTITTPSSETRGSNKGADMMIRQNTRFSIYADNTTTGGTPQTFSNVTSVSFKIKAVKNTRIPTIEVYVGSTKVRTVIGGDESSGSDGHEYDTSDFTTISVTGIASLSGVVKFVNTSSGSSDYKAYFDDIQICYGSGAASGHTVSFDMQDYGSQVADIENVPDGSKIGAPVPSPTAVGVEFGGWYNEEGCSSVWNFATGTITEDKTLYAKWTTCAPSISGQPSGNTYTQGAAATALSVTASGEDLNYQWYTSEDAGADISGSSAIPGATSASYTPSTALLGTIYYFCVVSNTCGNAVSNKAAITVNDSKPAPTAVWTIAEPKEGGKGFTFSIEVNKNDGTTNWDGELVASMLTLSDNAILDGASIVVDNTNKTISGTYGVKAGSSSPVTFYLLLPATDTQSATRLDQNRAFTPCAGGAGDSYNVPVRKDYEKDASNNYRWVTPGAGEITYAVSSSISSTKAASTVASVFDSIMSSDKQYVWVKTYEANTKTIRLYVETSGANISVNTLYKNTVYATAADKDIVSSDDYTVSYDGDGSAENTGTKGTHYMDITFDSPLAANDIICVKFSSSKVKAYGAVLTTVGDGGDQTTGLTWSNDQASGATVEKREDDPDFAITAVRDATALKSLGLISYTSSNTAIATIDGATGLVHIADNIDFGSDEFKTTTITATLAASGCYKKAVITYILKVIKYVCPDKPGTIEVTATNCSSQTLRVSGYEAGATIKWYKDGAVIPSATSAEYTATVAGEYYVVTHKTCDITSTNSINVTFATASAEKIVDQWYVKNGRRTPDIALVQTTNATSFTVTSGGTPIENIGGCTFELKEDGIIYLHGQKEEDGSAPSDMTAGDMTITITVSGCAGALSGLDITIHKQAETAKPSVAFVVDGTLRKDGGTATSVSEAKTSDRPLWKYLENTFTLTGCNAYWSVDSKELRQYYSQYDAILITDDPSTDTKGTGGVSYVKAFGTMVDVRPVLTMEAYVGKFKDGGWHVYDATPTSPNPRQVELKLECKNHDIFKGLDPETSDNVRVTKDEYDNEYWHVIMVDTTVAPYHNTSKDYKDLPALQGFDKTKFDRMLGVGTIAEETLQAGVERQEEPAARMMILGIQNEAMAALTNEGKLIVKNAIEYLLKTNMEDVNDCANYFTGGPSGTGDNWETPENWSSGKVPDFESRVRILRPVVISGGTKAIVARVDIATRGKSKWIDGECTGKVTVNSQGALIVSGKIRRAEAPHFGIDDLMPTENSDLIVRASSDGPHYQGALIHDNTDGLTHAEVEMWNPSYWEVEGGKKKKYWSYVAVPIQEADIPNFFWHGFTYLYNETSGWEKKFDGSSLYPFQGIGASLQTGNIEWFYGPLATTENQDITLTYTADKGQGMNLIGNSWTAPIQIANFEEDDFGDAAAEVWVFNTGHENEGSGSGSSTTAGQWNAIPINSASLPGYEGLKVIPAMQAFEVNTTVETTLHLDYDRLVRAGRENLNEPMRAPRRSAAKEIEATMRVRVSGELTHTDVYLLKDARFSDGFDNGWDGHYLSGDDRSAQLYAISEEEGKLAFLAQPEIEGTVLGFAPSKDGNEYTFSFSYDGDDEYYLNDLKLTSSTLISNESSYLFTYEAGDTNRFYISRQPLGGPAITTGVDEVREEAKPRKFIYNDKMYILFNGRVFDATGKAVK